MSRSQIRGGQIKDDSITGDDVDESTLVLNTLRDGDGDTKVQVEKTSDEVVFDKSNNLLENKIKSEVWFCCFIFYL